MEAKEVRKRSPAYRRAFTGNLPPQDSVPATAHTPLLPRPSGSRWPIPEATDDLSELLDLEERAAAQKNRERLCRRVSYMTLLALLTGAVLLLKYCKPVVEFRHRHHPGIAGARILMWVYLVSAMVASGIVAQLMVRILVSLVSRQLLLTPSLLYILRPLKGPMALTLHAGFCALLWWIMFAIHIESFDQDVYQAGRRISLTVLAFAVAHLLKGLLAKVAAMQFHRDSYFISMEKALVKEFYLQALSTLPNSTAEKSEKLFSSYIPFLSNNSGGGRSSEVSEGSRGPDPTKVAKLETYIRNHKLNDVFAREQDDSEGAHPLGDQAKIMTEHLWMNIHSLKEDESAHVTPADLQHFLPERLAQQAFELFDVNGDGCISKSELEKNVLGIFRERANLQKSLKDADSVVAKLEQCMAIVMYTLAGCVTLVLFKFDVLALMVTSSSIVVAGSFVFGSSLRLMFESFVFILSVHPFDVGDTLMIDGNQHEVVEVQLLSTVLQRWSGERIYYPNALMLSHPVINLSHSANHWEGCSLLIDHDTPMHKIHALRAATVAFLAANPYHFDHATDPGTLRVTEANQPLKVKLTAYFCMSNSGADLRRSGNARDVFVDWFRLKVAEMGITYHLPPVAEGGTPVSEVVTEAPQPSSVIPASVRVAQLQAHSLPSMTGMP